MSGRHALSKRRRTAFKASIFTIACTLPFALHANTHAVAETVHYLLGRHPCSHNVKTGDQRWRSGARTISP